MKIIDEIWVKKMLFIEEFGKSPQNLYLGHDEFLDLMKTANGNLISAYSKLQDFNENSIFEMKIFEINEKNHIGVGI